MAVMMIEDNVKTRIKRRNMMKNTIGKQEWIDLFKEIGLNDETMMTWHRVFEARHPDAHQSFLGWLGLSDDEITAIRTPDR
jgi:hypothetical protein